MATFLFSQVKGTSIRFLPATDVLVVDIGSAADLQVTPGASLRLRLGADTVTLGGVGAIGNLTSRNLVFSDGSRYLVGDDTTGTLNDARANVLVGGMGNDQLLGMGGDDRLDGAAGNDLLNGGSGNDTIEGGLGRDTAVFAGNRASYAVTYLADGSVRVQDLDAVANGNDGIDTLRNVERLAFRDAAVELTPPPPPPPVNAPPVAAADSASTGEDAGPRVIDVLGNDTDADVGDTRTVVAVDTTGMRGIAQVVSGGTAVLYYSNGAHEALRAGETATESFSYTMADASGARSSARVTVTITGSNDAPVANPDALTVLAGSDPVSIAALANDTDVDAGDTRVIAAVDGNGTPGWLELILIYGVGVGVWHEGTPPMRGSIAIAEGGGSLVYSPGSAFAYLRAGQVAADVATYVVADGSGATSTSIVTVNVVGVNDAPVAVADSVTLAKNASTTYVDVLANDTDVDVGDTKAIGALLAGTTLGSVSIAADGRGLLYTPGAAFAHLGVGMTATDRIAYTVIDAQGASASAELVVTITGGNSAPVAQDDTAAAIENGAAITINVLGNDVDADVADSRRVMAIDTAGTLGGVSIAADGASLRYAVGTAFQQLAAGATATDTFGYTMVDGGGAQSSARVTVTVTGTNDAPVAVANTLTLGEDSLTAFIDVLANDLDVDVGDTRSLLGLTTTGLKGTAVIVGGGVEYTPFQSLRAGQVATDTFTYRIADGQGAQASASVTVTVVGANDAPLARADALVITEDAAATTIAVLANDTDVDAGDTRRVVSVDGAGLRGTVAIASGGGSLTYAPGAAFQSLLAGQVATETFSYTMADAAGALSTASVTVTINGVTDPVRAIADTASATEDGGPITLDVLGNDLRGDLAPGAPLVITGVDGAGAFAGIELILIYGVGVGQFFPGFPRLLGNVQVAPDGGSLLYTPLQSLNAGETGVDQFRYTIRGVDGSTSTGEVSVTVVGANDAPEAHDDAVSIAADAGPVTIAVLANDTDPDTRIDPPAPPSDSMSWDPTPADVPDTKTVVAVDSTGLQGSVAITADGSGVTYTVGGALAALAFGASATETFTYTMRDAAGALSTASVSVTVHGSNAAPTARADSATTSEDAPVTINVRANDGDAEDGGVTLVALSLAGTRGSVSIVDGQAVYAPGTAFQALRAGEVAVDSFAYTVADSGGKQASAGVTVSITGANDAPRAVADVRSLSEDAAPTLLDVLANDTDVDAGDGRTIVAVDTTGLQGSVSIAPGGGALTYTVGSGFQALLTGQSATETFGYTMRDTAGALSSATVTLTIIGANEPVVIVTPPPPPPGAIVGSSGDDLIAGTAGADTVYGQAGDDEIAGAGGADVLFGGADDDTLDGGAGNDVLVGGAGRDDLTGGDGADIFRFYLPSESDSLRFDRIRDFDRSQGDRIDLSAIDANTVLGGNDAFSLVAAFTGSAGQLVGGSTASGYLVRGDVNGDAVADFAIEVRLVGATSLTAADFIL